MRSFPDERELSKRNEHASGQSEDERRPSSEIASLELVQREDRGGHEDRREARIFGYAVLELSDLSPLSA
jgi:hypothetical protein